MEYVVYSKLGAFYGPDGLMRIPLMQRPSYKVHGTAITIVSICT